MKKVLKLLLLLGLAVYLLAGCNQETPAPAPAQAEENTQVYWNVEKFLYSSVDTLRYPREDGNYYVRLATDGQQIDVPVAESLTCDFMDTLEVMGLEFDENGVVTRALRVEEMGYKIAVEDYVVEAVDGTKITVNSLGSRNGYSRTLDIDGALVYTVDMDGGVLCGLPGMVQENSKVTVLTDAAGKATHVFTEDPFQMQDIYWNTARKYDSALKMSTRETDAAGRFEYTFALNGEQVTYYTRDQKVANAIDSVAAKCMGLTFDEEGYISGTVSTKKATGNSSFGSWFHVTEIDGDFVTAYKFTAGNNHGTTHRGQFAPDCKVYDVSGTGAYIGEPTELRVHDQIHGLKNPFGQIVIIYVVSRSADVDMYYNVSRQWDSGSQSTKRLPDSEGWYHVLMTKDGEQVTLKTRDKSLASDIDKQAVRCVGIAVEGDEIKAVYPASGVWGGKQFCSYDIVTDITDNVVTALEQDASKGNKTYIGKMTENTKVYDCSASAAVLGQKTTLQVNDKIHALKDLEGNLTYVYIVDRPNYAKVYWNVDRQWDSKAAATKRTPDGDGWYSIVVAYGGKQQTLKTKDVELVNAMDQIATKCFGLDTAGDVITAVYATSKVYGGAQFCSWDTVTKVEGNYITAKEDDPAKGDKTYTGRLSSHVQVLDCSEYADFVGQSTTLREGDKIHALKRSDGTVTYVYIISRIKQKLVEEGYCSHCNQTVTWYSWDGVEVFEQDHYFLDGKTAVAATAYIGSAEDGSKEVTLDLRGDPIIASTRVFRVYGKLNIIDTVGGGSVTSKSSSQAAVFYVYKNAEMNIYGGTFTGNSTSASGGGTGAVDNGTLNIYGGTIKDGVSAGAGGNIAMFNTATINLYGGTIENGSAGTNGGNINMSAKGSLNIYGGSVIGGDVHAAGAVSLYGGDKITVSKLKLASGKVMEIVGLLADGSSIGLEGTGTVANSDYEENLGFFSIEDPDSLLKYNAGKIIIEPKPVAHEHCICGGTGDHGTCTSELYNVWTGELGTGTYNYCLVEDLTLEGMIDIPTGCTLNLCLNGFDIAGNDRVFQINGTLNLCDCKGTGEVTTTKVRQGSVFYVRDGGVFNLFGGTLKGTKTMASDGGLGVIGLNADGGAVMNMYGGTITGGATSKNGGNIYMYHDSTLNVYGGIIEKGHAESGGNIGMGNAKAVVNLYGGEIKDGTANGAAGNIRVSAGTLNVYTGTISGGKTVNGNGGSIFITGSNSAMNMYGGLVTGGYAGTGANQRSGGNIYAASSSKLQIVDDPAIEGVPAVTDGETQANNGGNIYYGGKSLTIDGAQITGGTAPGQGNDLYIATAGAVIKGVSVCGDAVAKVAADISGLDALADFKITFIS